MTDDPTPTPLTDAEASWGIGITPQRGSTLMFSRRTVERIVAARVAAARADERKKALTEAADAWVGGEWRPVLHNDAREDLTVAGRVTKWLRDRAAFARPADTEASS